MDTQVPPFAPKVLVVDDWHSMRERLLERLAAAGIEAVGADSLEAASRLLHQHKHSLCAIFTDIELNNQKQYASALPNQHNGFDWVIRKCALSRNCTFPDFYFISSQAVDELPHGELVNPVRSSPHCPTPMEYSGSIIKPLYAHSGKSLEELQEQFFHNVISAAQISVAKPRFQRVLQP